MGQDQTKHTELAPPNYDAAPWIGRWCATKLKRDKRIANRIHAEFELTEEGTNRVLDCLVMRNYWYPLAINVFPWLITATSYFLLMRLFPISFLTWASGKGVIGLWAVLLPVFVPPIVVFLMVHRVARKIMRHKVRACMTTPLCIYCGYDCSGLARTGTTIKCTECGNITPDLRGA